MAVESLSRMVNDGVHTLVHGDLVVERLAENVVARRVERHRGHGGHVGFLDVSRRRVVAVVPAQHLAVIRRADELPSVLVEAHRVHGRFVVVVRHRALHGMPTSSLTSPVRMSNWWIHESCEGVKKEFESEGAHTHWKGIVPLV